MASRPSAACSRRYRNGEAGIEAFCEDYAYLVWGLIELFQATGRVAWLEWALELTEVQAELFWDAQDGGWFSTTGTDASVLLRVKEDYDGAEPAAASVTVRNLITLGHLVGDAALLERAAAHPRTLRAGDRQSRARHAAHGRQHRAMAGRQHAGRHPGETGERRHTRARKRLSRPASAVGGDVCVSAMTGARALSSTLPWVAAMASRRAALRWPTCATTSRARRLSTTRRPWQPISRASAARRRLVRPESMARQVY